MTKTLNEVTEELVGEFEKQFVMRSASANFTVEVWKHKPVAGENVVGVYYGPEEIKDFLRSALLTVAKTMREECVVDENRFPHIDCGDDESCNCIEPDWNAARQDTLDKMDRFIGETKES